MLWTCDRRVQKSAASSERQQPVARLGRDAQAWIGPAEVAARLKVSRVTVYSLVKSGALTHRRVGLHIRISVSALEAFLAGS